MKSSTDLDLPAIALLVLDVDGILTDGNIYYGEHGETLKAFSTFDGLALKLLQKTGVKVAVITGRDSLPLHRRLDDLGITSRYVGIEHKGEAYQALLKKEGLLPHQIACMGDDIVDLPIMLACGLAITVPEAPELVQQHAHWITARTGGKGAVREACEGIMKAQGTWDAVIAHFLMPAVRLS